MLHVKFLKSLIFMGHLQIFTEIIFFRTFVKFKIILLLMYVKFGQVHFIIILNIQLFILII